MIDNIISQAKDRSIVVLSSPRTGSTLLAMMLTNKLGYKLFSEPAGVALHELFLYKEHGKKFVVKEHALRFMHYPSSFHNQDMYVIRLRREDVADQVLSCYIANQRKKWFYHDIEKPDSIQIDDTQLTSTLNYIKKFNDYTDAYKGKVDIDLYYEDLSNIDYNGNTIPTPKPTNHDQLKLWVQSKL
jgi:LPS sulfotransferase NodH